MIFRSHYPSVKIPRVTLHDFVLAGAAARGDAPALVEGATGRVLTYGQLVDQTRRFAAGLARAGIRQGDVLLAFNGEKVTSVDQLRQLVGKAKGKAAVLVQREDARLYIPIKIG